MNQKETDKVVAMYSKFNYKCFVCGNPATQRAHIIGNTKSNRRSYGREVIDNSLNWLPACSLRCNSLIDIGKSGALKNTIYRKIKSCDGDAVLDTVILNIKRKRGKL